MHQGRPVVIPETQEGWSIEELPPEARRAAEAAADAAGMPVDTWLNQLIKYVSTMELSARKTRALAQAEAALWGGGPRRHERSEPAELEMPLEMPAPPAPKVHPASVATEALAPNRFEGEPPRERDIESAVENWRRTGSLQPVQVRPDPSRHDGYEIVTGVERWYAAKQLKMRQVPVAVRELTDEEVLRATLVERAMKRSLPPLEVSRIYRQLLSETGMTVETLADAIGRSPTHVATMLRLLELPESVQTMLNHGQLTVLHARTLLEAPDPDATAREVVARKLDIYQTEQLVRANREGRKAIEPATQAPPPGLLSDMNVVERHLSRLLGIRAVVDGNEDAGTIAIRYSSKKDLAELITRLSRVR